MWSVLGDIRKKSFSLTADGPQGRDIHPSGLKFSIELLEVGVGCAVCPQKDQLWPLSEVGCQPTWVIAGVQFGTGDPKDYGAPSSLVLALNRTWKHFPAL